MGAEGIEAGGWLRRNGGPRNRRVEAGGWLRRNRGHGNRRNRGRRMMDDGRGIECIGAGGWFRRNGGHGNRRNRGRMMVEKEWRAWEQKE